MNNQRESPGNLVAACWGGNFHDFFMRARIFSLHQSRQIFHRSGFRITKI